MAISVVDRLHRDFNDILYLLSNAAEVSLVNVIEENTRKSLLLCAASYFENRLTAEVEKFAEEVSGNNQLITSLIKNKAINRQYHTWFAWDCGNANSFFGLFGEQFKCYMKRRIEDDDDIGKSIKSFLEIGRERNRLVHLDFGTFSLEKTAEEIYSLYVDAHKFIDLLPKALRDYSNMSLCVSGEDTANAIRN